MSDKAFDRSFCSAVFQTIASHHLFTVEERGLVAVSGGLDSMVLLHFFQRFAQRKYGNEFYVAHLDHGVRPDSKADADWLEEYCSTHGLRFLRGHLNRDNSSGASLEAQMRQARYEWLSQQAQLYGCQWVATGHHAHDQAETLVMRWIRGGISGLSGMPIQRSLDEKTRLIRPLLLQSRMQLMAYARDHQLVWREDSSNQDLGFFRNRVRHQILPVLESENPQLSMHWAQQAEIWQDEQAYLAQQAHLLYIAHVHIQNGIQSVSSETFESWPLAMRRLVIKEILQQHEGKWREYTMAHVQAICALAQAENGKQLSFFKRLEVRKQRGNLFFCPPETVLK